VPAPGRIALLRLPTGPGVRVDTGVAEGDTIPPEFDSMVAKLIAWGRDRDEALSRLRRALGETMVVVEGGTTNQGFLLALLERDEVRHGTVDTGWLDRLQLRGEIVSARHADVALLQAAIVLADGETAADRARFYAYARRGRPQTDLPASRAVHLRHRGQSYRLAVSQLAPDRHRVVVDGVSVEVASQHVGRHERRLTLGGAHHRTLSRRRSSCRSRSPRATRSRPATSSPSSRA
jgi:acetyl/propionyl-CoA carboxylase alpha subunit